VLVLFLTLTVCYASRRAHEQFIRDKYERKLFTEEASIRHSSHKSSSGGSGQYASELKKLRDMGFTDAEENVVALKKSGGNVNDAVSLLIQKPGKSSSAPSTSAEQQSLSALKSMGFSNEAANKRALQQTNNNVTEAVKVLVQQANVQVPALAAPGGTVNKPAAAKPQANLLGDDLFGAPVAAAPSKPAASNNGFADFGDFSNARNDLPALRPVAI